ncbi:hypothetical protein IWW48_003720 [Coemansia sp. RSA 1200]|nr:hypothetical protein IWW48_003720 [Coemansia sp. RSA 1200]
MHNVGHDLDEIHGTIEIAQWFSHMCHNNVLISAKQNQMQAFVIAITAEVIYRCRNSVKYVAENACCGILIITFAIIGLVKLNSATGYDSQIAAIYLPIIDKFVTNLAKMPSLVAHVIARIKGQLNLRALNDIVVVFGGSNFSA